MISFFQKVPVRATYAALLVALGVGNGSGCSSPGVNHIHNPDNLVKATEAASIFDAATSSRAGLPAKMLANLAAERNLREAVASTQNELLDLASLHAINDLTWESLRREFSSEFGLHGTDDLPILVYALANANRISSPARRASLRREATALALLAAKTSTPAPEDNGHNYRNDLVSAPLDDLLTRYPEIHPTTSRELAHARLPLTHLDMLLVPVTAEDIEAAVGLSLEEIGLRFNSASTDPAAEARAKLGGVFPAEPRDTAPVIAEATATIQEHKITEQIQRRMAMLAKVLRTYEVLIKGERARLAIYKQAAGDLARKSQADFGTPEGAEPSEGPDSQDAALDLLFSLRSAITQHWRRREVQQEYLAQASELQRLLLSSAATSKDPASVYSLVPLVGEGLAPDDLGWLESYLYSLNAALATMTEDEERLRRSLAKPGASQPTQARKSARERDPINAFLDALTQLRQDMSTDRLADVDLSRMLADAVEAADALALDLDILKAEHIRHAAETTAPAIQALMQGAAKGTLDDEQAKTLVRFVVGPQRGGELDRAFNAAVSPEAVKAMKDLLADIAREDTSAAKRVADYVVALQRLHVALHEESVRHYLALSVIAKAEVSRWETLSDLAGSFDLLYGPYDGSDRGFFGLRVPPESSLAPDVTIELDSTVVATIRLLAEVAHAFQTGSQRNPDPDQATTELWARSLANAMEALQTYQLMGTVNRRRAADNSISLISEIGEHDIHLDHLLTAGIEEEIRLALAQQRAFHASGITEGDLELLIRVIQSALLAWIGSEQ